MGKGFVVGLLAVPAFVGLAPSGRAQAAPVAGIVPAAASAGDPAAPGQGEGPWRAGQVIEPAALARVLTGGHGQKPVLLYVGFPLLYAGGHIPGARYLGPASTPAGLEALRAAVKELPREAGIVLYCGCCPWNVCPNIRPAFRLLQDLGYLNVKVLDIPVNFAHDWTAKGFPVEKGSAPS